MDASDVEQVAHQPVHLRNQAPVRRGARQEALALRTLARPPDQKIRAQREPAQERAQIVADIRQKLIPHRDQLVREAALTLEILVGGLPLDGEEIIQIAPARDALHLEQVVSGAALLAHHAVLPGSLTPGARLGLLEHEIGVVSCGLDHLVRAVARSLDHLIGCFLDEIFAPLQDPGVGFEPLGAEALVGPLSLRLLELLGWLFRRLHGPSPGRG